MSTRRTLSIALLLFALALLAGCIISEFDEFRLTINPDGKTGVLELTRRNVQSDESSPEKQQHDFKELLSDWKSDTYLIEQLSEGYYVKKRSLRIEKGVLVWKQQLLFANLRTILGSDVSNDSLHFRLEHSDVIVSTNGTIRRYPDSTVVTWPIAPGTFTLKLRRSQFTPTSDFVKLFKESRRAPASHRKSKH